MEEPAVCPVCVVFEPQAWRKSLCRNCFKTFEQHEGSLVTEEDSTQEGGGPPVKANDSQDVVPPPPAATTQPSSSKSSVALSSSTISDKATPSKTTTSSSTITTSSTTPTTTTAATATATLSPTSPTPSKTSTTVQSKTREAATSKVEDSKKGAGGVKANGAPASPGKSSGDKKVTLVSSLAGKIEQPKRSAATSVTTTSPTSSKQSTTTTATTSSKQSTTPATAATDSKVKSASERKAAVSGAAGKPSSAKESAPSPASPSSAAPPSSPATSSASATPGDSVRSKWEKRVASAGGGGTGGTELGAKYDVKKGQKATDAKVKSAESGDVASKSRVGDIGKKVSKEASQTDDSATAAAVSSTAPISSTAPVSSTATESNAVAEKKTTDKQPQKQSPASPEAASVNANAVSAASRDKSLTSKAKPPEHVSPAVSVTPVDNTAPTTSLKSTSSACKASATAVPAIVAVTKQDVTAKSQTTIKSASTTKVDGKELQQQQVGKQASPVKSAGDPAKKEDVLRTDVEQLEKELRQKEDVLLKKLAEKEESLLRDLAAKEQEVDTLKKRLVDMETECGQLKTQAEEARRDAVRGQREELEKTLGDLRQQVSGMEEQCSRLESDNQSLLNKLREQERQVADHQQQVGDSNDSSWREVSGLQGDLKTSEIEVEALREENTELRHELEDVKREMDEMYDSFRENELDEFRELQRELDLTAKNCRVLQFKLRKAERRNEQVEHERQHYEEKLRSLQQQFESGDARSHIEALEEELRTAKEVSVRLHDELDLMEERRNKALDENRHLTELLEQTDKKQFRMEMEIDKLRDQIADLRQQLRDRSPARKEGTPDRKQDVLGRQGSQEYDSAQLMRDLCDSVERETDLKEQIKFIEEESRMLRKKLSEMEDENEALRVQLKKLSLKASRWKEESEGKGHSLTHKQEDSDGTRERLDSSDDESSVVTLKLQVAMMEQELMTSQRARDQAEKEAEMLRAEIASLEQRVHDHEHEAAVRREHAAPPPPADMYYEDKVRELTQVADELRWRVIEKDRELERLSAIYVPHVRHAGHHGHHGNQTRDGRLKKSKSLDSDHVVDNLRRQLDSAACDATTLRHQVTQARDERDKAEKVTSKLQERVKELEQQIERSARECRPLLVTLPSVQADDAAVENIELKDSLRRSEEEARALRDQVRVLTDSLCTLSRSSSPRPAGSGTGLTHAASQPPLLPASGASDRPATGADLLCSAATPSTAAAPAVATATIASTSLAGSCSPGVSTGIPHVPDDARALHELLREADEERRVLVSKMAELEQENARLRTLLGPDTRPTGGVASTGLEGEGQKRRTDGQTRQTAGTSGSNSDSREDLMDNVRDMEQEIKDLLLVVKRQEEKEAGLSRELTSLRAELQSAKDHGRRTELELLKDLDMLHDKNSVLSNLLDIVQDRATAAEEELEKLMQEHSSPSTRSASAVSAVSVLSDASCGSDEVFLAPPCGAVGDKGQIIHRDWEAKLKNRIESLERLLAEERQKVSMAEKKLRMACIETLAPSVSDDIKLRVREKELLQEELLENQRHLHIAADQIKGLRERLHAMEEEHHRLKLDYGKLVSELDKRDELDSDQTAEDSDKTPENSVEPEGALVAIRAASLLEQDASPRRPNDPAKVKQMKGGKEGAGVARDTIPEARAVQDDVGALQSDLALYKLKAEQLEYKVQEISDIWRSKSAATEREKKALEEGLQEQTGKMAQMNETITKLRQEIHKRREEVEREVAEARLQAAEQQTTVRELRESVSTRDDRLKEKDDIIRYLNTCLEERQKEVQQLDTRVSDMTSRLADQAASLALLQEPVTVVSSVKEDGGETDLEKENRKLRETTRALRAELEQGDASRQEVEMARSSMEEMLKTWKKEKGDLQASLNIAEEKLRLYETLSASSVNEAMESLKVDSMKYFSEKESFKSQVSFLRHELSLCQRQSKETISRLQSELSSKLRMLKEEVDANNRLQPEIERLKLQGERAYRLQQEERILRAEHQAMKVRYETRLQHLSTAYSKMLLTVEELHKEKQLDKEMVAGAQKAMALVREAHAQDQARWEDEKTHLERQLREMDEMRQVVDKLRKMTHELKEQVCEQERGRVDLVNKFSTDRAAWDMERAALHSKINQLDEQLARGRKDGGPVMPLEAAWAKERANQQRLLAQAHDLALDLQRQLQSRDQEATRSRRLLAEQLETERQAWDKERREKDKLLSELDARLKHQGSLQRHVTEAQERAEREAQQARRDRAELLSRFAELRQQLSRDSKAVDDVMSGFVRLRELAAVLTSQEDESDSDVDVKGKAAVTGQQGTSSDSCLSETDKDILKYIKEAFIQISAAAAQLARRGNLENGGMRRSLTSSDLELMREELAVLRHEGDDVFPVHDVTSLSRDQELAQLQQPPTTGDKESAIPLPATASPLSMSPHCVQLPSYASGTCSAQVSRSASPEVGHPRSSDVSPSRQSHKVLELSPTSLVPAASKGSAENFNSSKEKQRKLSTERALRTPALVPTPLSDHKEGSQPAAQASATKPARPHTLTKSLSVDSPQPWSPTGPVTSHKKSLSASTTPTQPPPSIPLASPYDEDSSAGSSDASKRQHVASSWSPRSARKRFFEEQPAGQAYLSWPERGRLGGPQAYRARGQSPVDPSEVRRVAEEEHDWLLARVQDASQQPPASMRASSSWDEKMHHGLMATPPDAASPCASPDQRPTPDAPLSQPRTVTTDAGVTCPHAARTGQQASAKDRRRLFKKSGSLDSTVGTCIARAGMQALGPPAVPAAFSPADILTSLKGRLAPPLRTKPGKEGDIPEARPPSPLFIPTTVPDIPLRPSSVTVSSLVTPTSPATATTDVTLQESPRSEAPSCQGGQLFSQQARSFLPTEAVRGRDSRRSDVRAEVGGDARDTRWRSMSADRATRPLLVHSDVLVPAHVWQFSETAV